MRQVYGTRRIDAHGQVLDQEEAMLRQDAESHLLLAHLVSERESPDPLRRNKHTTGVDHQGRPSTFNDDSIAALLDLPSPRVSSSTQVAYSNDSDTMAALLDRLPSPRMQPPAQRQNEYTLGVTSDSTQLELGDRFRT
jgi:hypothetical protein